MRALYLSLMDALTAVNPTSLFFIKALPLPLWLKARVLICMQSRMLLKPQSPHCCVLSGQEQAVHAECYCQVKPYV